MTATPHSVRTEPQSRGSLLRRNPSFWGFFRLLLGVGGAALVLLPVASGNSYILSIAGLVMFLTAILLLPARPRVNFEDKAREVGALFVVDGGRYQVPNSSSLIPVELFIGTDRISAFGEKFRLVLEIPTAEITSLLTLQEEKGWFLEVIWSTGAAEFSFHGASAERLAHTAENAIRRVAPAPASPTPQRRAAGA